MVVGGMGRVVMRERVIPNRMLKLTRSSGIVV